MKILPLQYKESYLIEDYIYSKNIQEMNFEFIKRITAYCQDVLKRKITGSGFRTLTEQDYLYKLYKSGKGNYAVQAGRSWHNYGLAFDINHLKKVNGKSIYGGSIDSEYLLFMKGEPEPILNSYGLSHAVAGEPWHIQPIETVEYSGDRKQFLDKNDIKYSEGVKPMLFKGCPNGEPVKEWQDSLVKIGFQIKIDGDYGAGTENATIAFKKSVGLPQNGNVDEITYAKMLNKLQSLVILKPTGITQAQLDVEKTKLSNFKKELSNLILKY